MQVNFDKVLIHASSMGVLFTEPRDAAAKKNGELSQTAKSHLIKVYAEHYWGRKEDITTKQMEKGTHGEESLIDLIGMIYGKLYVKNDIRKENEYATGICDIDDEEDDLIIDGKSSWSALTFLPKIIEPIDKGYEIQLQTYMWLYNRSKARLCYGLINTPDFILQNELRKLLFSLNVISDESPEYKEAAQELIKNHVFDDIPIQQRLITIEIPRNNELIDQMPGKVEKAREFLQQFHKKHTKLNKLN